MNSKKRCRSCGEYHPTEEMIKIPLGHVCDNNKCVMIMDKHTFKDVYNHHQSYDSIDTEWVKHEDAVKLEATIEELTTNAEKYYNECEDALVKVEEQAAHIELLREAKPCINPSCQNDGCIPHQIADDEWEAEQCEFCYTVEDSLFNVRNSTPKQSLAQHDKKIAVDFFRHWWNTGGTNTEQGFDDWYAEQLRGKK